jgi:O-antigen/teichoic acid export membrane protein
MATLRRSLVINFFSSSGASLLQFVVSVLLARILSPSEIGVFSMTVVVVNIAHIFREFGVSTYLQREPHLTPEKVRAAIGVLLTSSWLIALCLYLLSSSIGRWFGEPQIAPVMQVLAIGFLVIPFGSVAHSLLVREFAADKQAIVTAAGTVTYCITCVGLALAGYGSMSLAWANLANIVVCAIVYIPLRPKGYPVLPSLRHWGGVLHFGAGTLISNCAVAVNNAIPDLLLGKLGSARLVGLSSRANSTVSIFTYIAGSTVTYGAVAYMSQAHDRGESLVPVVRRATSLLTAFGWPALALTALFGKEIVLALYGERWLDCVPAILPFTLMAAVSMLFHYTPTALIAIGRPYLGAVPVLLTLLARVVFGYLLFDGTLTSFAWAMCLATLVALPVQAMQQRRYLGFTTRHLLRSMANSLFVTIGCLAMAGFLQMLLPQSIPAVARLSLLAMPLMALWYLMLRITQHELLVEVHHLLSGLKTRMLKLSGLKT